jgi:hypothetical protein
LGRFFYPIVQRSRGGHLALEIWSGHELRALKSLMNLALFCQNRMPSYTLDCMMQKRYHCATLDDARRRPGRATSRDSSKGASASGGVGQPWHEPHVSINQL